MGGIAIEPRAKDLLGVRAQPGWRSAGAFGASVEADAQPDLRDVAVGALGAIDETGLVQCRVQRNFVQRDKLPPIETPPGLVELHGRLAPPPGKLYEFAGAGLGPIRQNIDLAQFRAETGLALLDLAVQQTGEPSEGLLREWPEAASGAPKHYGYAFQWWALSALIAILYVWFQFIAPRRKALHV